MPACKATPPADPSRLTKVELAGMGASAITAAGALVSRLGKSAEAAEAVALHRTISGFIEHERTIHSTCELMSKIRSGAIDLGDAIDEVLQQQQQQQQQQHTQKRRQNRGNTNLNQQNNT